MGDTLRATVLAVSAQAPTIPVCRRASIEDTQALVGLASRFVSRSPFARFVCYDPEVARDTILAIIDRGAVFVLESEGRVVGAIIGAQAPLWFSRDVAATELGWWIDPDYRGRGNDLRREFEHWAHEVGASVVVMSDVTMDDATPAGTLYERAGYEMVERAWMKAVS